jgi:deoxyribodipyrimidine photolyase-related protein
MSKAKNITKNTLRLLLGDQLNINHTWFKQVNDSVTYVLMEVRSETDYVNHHIQKILAFFAAMRFFAKEIEGLGHRVIYLKLNDKSNKQTFNQNIIDLIDKNKYLHFEYMEPDEFRVDKILKDLCMELTITSQMVSSEHFYTSRSELTELFKGKNKFLMETFYRYMRKKHSILMDGDQPLKGRWNFDSENRKKLPKQHQVKSPLLFKNDLSDLLEDIIKNKINFIGRVNADEFIWPINRKDSLKLLDFFISDCLPSFGLFQDAMALNKWSLYHSRLSFALNIKLISPKEVIEKVIKAYFKRSEKIDFAQVEGFVRQILGWREYMRGIYWNQMPGYENLNFFNHQNKLPEWYWNGETRMQCLDQAIKQSLDYAYAHHIQRLMITGNFALLAGVNPNELDQWYLGIYIDAIEWVEITNTRGMSQFADGGLLATKPYISSASYIDKMSDYCASCYYNKNLKTGERACPFNSMYWNFLAVNRKLLISNQRMSMMYSVWDKMDKSIQQDILNQAQKYLNNMHSL